MAFKATQARKQKSAETPVTEQAFVPLINFNVYEKEGKRVVRWLPESLGSKEPSEPHTGYELWLEVNTKENGKRKVRIWVDKYWKKHLPEPLKTRWRWLINVYDITPVFLTPEGLPIYPNLQMQYKGKDTKVEKPKPHNRIMVYEGGFTLLQQIESLDDTVFDDDSNHIRLVDFAIALQRVGLEFENTQWSAKETTIRTPLADEVFYLPRYDLDRYMRTMEDHRVQALIDGETWEDVIEDIKDQFDLAPKLVGESSGTFF